MTSDRWAGPSIIGYLYQFEHSILQILRAESVERVVIEGIEDVDIITPSDRTVVQVKYHAGQKYATPRSIREPVEGLLDGYSKETKLRPVLYAHFATGVVPQRLTIADLKIALTSGRASTPWERWSRYDDAILRGFCSVFRIVSGESRIGQKQRLIDELATVFHVNEATAEAVYYPAALSYVAELAVVKNAAQRTTDRAHFIKELSYLAAVWTKWHAKVVDRRRWLRELVRDHKLRYALRSRGTRTLAIGFEHASPTCEDAASVIEALGQRGFLGLLDRANPWTVIFESEARLDEVCQHLTARDISFNTGSTAYGFSAHLFNSRPMVRLKGSEITQASYLVRLISIDRAEECGIDLTTDALVRWGSNFKSAASVLREGRRPIDLEDLSASEMVSYVIGAQT